MNWREGDGSRYSRSVWALRHLAWVLLSLHLQLGRLGVGLSDSWLCEQGVSLCTGASGMVRGGRGGGYSAVMMEMATVMSWKGGLGARKKFKGRRAKSAFPKDHFIHLVDN